MTEPVFKKSRFRDECDVCHEWKDECAGFKGMLICKGCYEETHGIIELKEPIQTDIFQFMGDEEK